MQRNRLAITIFLAALLAYVGTAPGLIPWTYATENLTAARAFLDAGSLRAVTPWSKGFPAHPRTGYLEATIYVPVVALARAVAPGNAAAEEWLASLLPALWTALIVAIVAVWCSDLGASAARVVAVSASLGFGTMLWPYSGIGLEPLLSLGVIASGYSTFRFGRDGGSRWAALAGASAGVAVGAKLAALLAIPAVGLYFVETLLRRRGRWPHALAFAVPLTLGYLVSEISRADSLVLLYGGGLGATAVGPWTFLFGLWGQFFSPNKSLALYAPMVLVGAAALPILWRANGPLARWISLLCAGVCVGMATRFFWADECWGPRYHHVLVAPMVLPLAVVPLTRARRGAWAAAAALGLCVSALGVLFWYAHLFEAMGARKANEFNRILFDPTWNPIEFHARLALAKVDGRPTTFTPSSLWWLTGAPSRAAPIDLEPYPFAPLVLNHPNAPRAGAWRCRGGRTAHAVALVIGGALCLSLAGRALGFRYHSHESTSRSNVPDVS